MWTKIEKAKEDEPRGGVGGGAKSVIVREDLMITTWSVFKR
jgi:hypothetical protein